MIYCCCYYQIIYQKFYFYMSAFVVFEMLVFYWRHLPIFCTFNSKYMNSAYVVFINSYNCVKLTIWYFEEFSFWMNNINKLNPNSSKTIFALLCIKLIFYICILEQRYSFFFICILLYNDINRTIGFSLSSVNHINLEHLELYNIYICIDWHNKESIKKKMKLCSSDYFLRIDFNDLFDKRSMRCDHKWQYLQQTLCEQNWWYDVTSVPFLSVSFNQYCSLTIVVGLTWLYIQKKQNNWYICVRIHQLMNNSIV